MGKLAAKMTIYWLKRRGLGFKGIRRLRLCNGQKVEVIVFSSVISRIVGQYTPCKIILVNERILGNSEFVNRILIHELAHKRQWYSWVLYAAIPLVAIGFLGLMGSLVLFLASIYFHDFSGALSAGTVLVMSLCLGFIPCSLSWLCEYKAENAVFRVMGPERVEAIDAEIKKLFPGQVSFIDRIIIRMTHPTHKFNVKVYRHFNKQPEGHAD